MAVMRWKNYVATIDYDPDMKMFHGRVVNANSVVTFYGKSAEELELEFKRSMEEYLAICKERGIAPDKPFSGRFNLRVTPEEHREFSAAAAANGKSLNTWAAEVLRNAAH